MNKKTIVIALVPLLLITLALIFWTSEEKVDVITAEVQRGEFQVKIYTSGQLESETSENISAPEKMKDRSLRIYELSITDMIEEGTLVDSGDYVATLDHKTVEEELKKVQDDIEKTYSEYEDAKIDSMLTLSNQRDNIVNASLDLIEKKIEMEQSIYESPAVQKKTEMDYQKAERKYEQEKQALDLKQQQEANKVDRRYINYRQLKEREEGLRELFNSLVIYAPKSGILTYFKYPWGEVVAVGSRISSYRGDIAKIPDMNHLISRTFVNEIDISKVKVGQKVSIGIDAFPDKELEGEVVTMANVGQPMPGSDAKVFEVKIKVFDKDGELKPAMTTSNIIYGSNFSDTLYIPSDAVFENDSLRYVYLKKRNFKKQIVKLGEQNENFVVVNAGLSEGDEVSLVELDNSDKLDWEGLDIYEQIVKDEEERKELAAKERERLKNEKKENKMAPGMPSGMPANVVIRQ
ncbi:efflux RND transporter periplasmic adaptor subunit [Sunxiuqinia sp. A32]|uniref:efflux RND transporter periplasmic adaptor subunit n=1 Tax=Sunxiuqinia sp. A32 TaxID=3461496 RepID=UPI0040458050